MRKELLCVFLIVIFILAVECGCRVFLDVIQIDAVGILMDIL